jgi:tetratricopeptide (TPR) repeat protein
MKKIFLLMMLAGMAGAMNAQTTAQEWFNKGKSLKSDEKYKDAVEAFKKAVALKANYGEALHQLGWCYNELEMYNEALDALQKEEAAKPDDKAANWQEMGYAYKGLKKYDDAILYFNKAIADDPEYALPYKERGYAYYKKQDYSKALDDFNKYASLKDDISDVDFYYDKAWCENELEKFDEAVTSLNKCVSLDETYADAYSELGFSYYKLKRNDEALAAYRKANNLDAKKQLGIIGMADVFYMNLKNYDSAIYYLQKATSFNKTNKSVYYKLGWCYNDKERYEDAVAPLKQAVSIDKDYVLALQELGYSLYKTKKYDEALVYLKQVVSKDAKSELGRYYAGLCYNAKGNKADLRKMYDELKAMNSDYANDLFKLL